MLLHISVALAAIQICAVSAQNSTSLRSTTKVATHTTEQCITLLGTTSPSDVSTSTTTTTIESGLQNYTITSTPVITFVPIEATVSTTKTKYKTTTIKANQTTDVETEYKSTTTTIYTELLPVTVTTSANVTETTTLTTATSTILPPTTGYYPIGSTQNMTYPKVKRHLPGLERAEKSGPKVERAASVPKVGLNVDAVFYPTAIACSPECQSGKSLATAPPSNQTILTVHTGTESIVIKTGATTFIPATDTTRSVTKKQQTTTSHITTTILATITIYPGNKTTTTTITNTSSYTYTRTPATFTSTIFTTFTAILPTGTVAVYGACGTAEILGPTLPSGYPNAGLAIADVYFDEVGHQNTVTSHADSAYDCCVQCIDSTDGCTFGAFGTSQPICYLQVAAVGHCNKQKSAAGEYVVEPSNSTFASESAPFEVFNGYCGYLYDGGLGS